MKDWKKTLVSPDITIYQALHQLEESALQALLVVDGCQCLLGVVTDGDIRRGLLEKNSLETKISLVMNSEPMVVSPGTTPDEIRDLMIKHSIHQIPVVDSENRIITLEFFEKLLQSVKHDNPVVIMAGGLGSRLKTLTKDCPKPLLKIGEKPLIETIIDRFISQGFYNFYLAVNYKAEMFKEHFGDGNQKGVSITYLEEEKKLGTAGALSLLKDRSKSVIVTNGDVLTRVNYSSLLDYHLDSESVATMGVREYQHQVPYGIVKTKQGQIEELSEKPTYKEYINAGIYCLSPQALDMVPHDQKYDMTTLFNDLLERDLKTQVFLLHEYWLDIGLPDDFKKASEDYKKLF